MWTLQCVRKVIFQENDLTYRKQAYQIGDKYVGTVQFDVRQLNRSDMVSGGWHRYT